MTELKTRLQRDVASLRHLLDDVIREQMGGERLAIVEELRRLAKERRTELPGAEEKLVNRIRLLNESEVQTSIRALSIFFDLANIAEDLQRVRVIRHRERETAPHPRAEAIGAAIERFRENGFSAEEVQQLLDTLRIELVLTAHPTEAKRRTVRGLLRRMRGHLKETDRKALLPRERDRLVEQMRSELTILWQTDLLRPHQPQVIDEVERGLFFTEGLWEVVPEIYCDLRQALERFYPGHRFQLSRFLRFGSWIGGDRDGNPYVTMQVTARTLAMLRQAAIEQHLMQCRNLLELLVVSHRQTGLSEALKQAVNEAAARWPELQTRLDTVSDAEDYRRWLKVIEFRLERTRAAAIAAAQYADNIDSQTWEFSGSMDEAVYHRSAELGADLRLMSESLQAYGGQRIAAGALQDWQDLLQTFGLHLAALDIRQDSRVHVEVLTEVLRHLGVTENYAALSEPDKQTLLTQLIKQSQELPRESLSEQTDDTIALFRLMVHTAQTYGLEALGGHVISMTHHPSDVLAVLWLWTTAWTEAANGEPAPTLPVIPLFETIDDLHRAADVMDGILSNSTYAHSLQQDEVPTQIVMVGYSDSTKDGGYLAASWGLQRTQEQLAAVAERYGVRLIVFHGRGGALGRGGGPAARAILSLPPKSVNGALRMTEQGEVLAERYDDPQIAHRHLEQVTWATLLVSAEAVRGAPSMAPEQPRWTEALDKMAQQSYEHYRRLVEDPRFLAYFEQATPISEIERFPIGSRPARRRERTSLADLRAIPWTFAWTQCRQLIPAWYGLGTAVHAFVEQSGGEWSFLQDMYSQSAWFRALIDNADLALAKADFAIGHRYADLVLDHESGEGLWNLIAQEFRLTRSVVLLITGQTELLGGTPWLRRSIQERNPYVDPLTLIQIELIRRVRQLSADERNEEVERLRELLRLSIQGVAAGLRTTG